MPLSREFGFPDVTGCTPPLWQVTELVLICCPSPVTEASWIWGPGSAHWICPVAPGETVGGMGQQSHLLRNKPHSKGSQQDSSWAPLEVEAWRRLLHGRTCHGGKSFGVHATPDSVLLTRTISKNPGKGSSKTIHGLGTPESHVWKCTPGNIR